MWISSSPPVSFTEEFFSLIRHTILVYARASAPSWPALLPHTWSGKTDCLPSRARCAFFPGWDSVLEGVLEDGVTSNGVPRSTAPSGISNPEKKMSCGTQCPNPQSLSSGPLTQKQNGLRTAEAKRETKRMTAKEVTINVADSIRQVDRSRRIAKNCIN
uniref:BAALC binder of MAP3K1 and KLF4 n=1 Tax=Bos indicus x Bos taurus TaxID=30522 RepID=A0A4W2CS11_BOBOX